MCSGQELGRLDLDDLGRICPELVELKMSSAEFRPKLADILYVSLEFGPDLASRSNSNSHIYLTISPKVTSRTPGHATVKQLLW